MRYANIVTYVTSIYKLCENFVTFGKVKDFSIRIFVNNYMKT